MLYYVDVFHKNESDISWELDKKNLSFFFYLAYIKENVSNGFINYWIFNKFVQ